MVKRVPKSPTRFSLRSTAALHAVSTMLMSGMGEARWTSSNTMCGVLEDSSPCVAPDFVEHVRGQARQVVRADELQGFCQVDAVDDDGRITPVRPALPVSGNEEPVIIDRGFRTDAADDADQLHRECSERAYGSCESIRMKATRQGLPLRLTQAWLVACWTTTSPAFRCTSLSSSNMSISPDMMIA